METQAMRFLSEKCVHNHNTYFCKRIRSHRHTSSLFNFFMLTQQMQCRCKGKMTAEKFEYIPPQFSRSQTLTITHWRYCAMSQWCIFVIVLQLICVVTIMYSLGAFHLMIMNLIVSILFRSFVFISIDITCFEIWQGVFLSYRQSR